MEPRQAPTRALMTSKADWGGSLRGIAGTLGGDWGALAGALAQPVGRDAKERSRTGIVGKMAVEQNSLAKGVQALGRVKG